MSCETNKKDYVRHVVVFKYKPEATECQINEITDAFRGLKDKIPGIIAFETGINNSQQFLLFGTSQYCHFCYFFAMQLLIFI